MLQGGRTPPGPLCCRDPAAPQLLTQPCTPRPALTPHLQPLMGDRDPLLFPGTHLGFLLPSYPGPHLGLQLPSSQGPHLGIRLVSPVVPHLRPGSCLPRPHNVGLQPVSSPSLHLGFRPLSPLAPHLQLLVLSSLAPSLGLWLFPSVPKLWL